MIPKMNVFKFVYFACFIFIHLQLSFASVTYVVEPEGYEGLDLNSPWPTFKRTVTALGNTYYSGINRDIDFTIEGNFITCAGCFLIGRGGQIIAVENVLDNKNNLNFYETDGTLQHSIEILGVPVGGAINQNGILYVSVVNTIRNQADYAEEKASIIAIDTTTFVELWSTATSSSGPMTITNWGIHFCNGLYNASSGSPVWNHSINVVNIPCGDGKNGQDTFLSISLDGLSMYVVGSFYRDLQGGHTVGLGSVNIADGTSNWVSTLIYTSGRGIISAPSVSKHGVIVSYVASMDGYYFDRSNAICKLTLTNTVGELKWKIEDSCPDDWIEYTDENGFCNSAISSDVVYWTSCSGHVSAVNALDGSYIWQVTVQMADYDNLVGDVVVDENGIMYVSSEYNLYALDPSTGNTLWQKNVYIVDKAVDITGSLRAVGYHSMIGLNGGEGSHCQPGEMVYQDSCLLCPVGYYSPEGFYCYYCEAGSYTGTSLEGASECNTCEVGSYSNSDLNTNCTLCPIGYYASSSGSDECKYCSDGSYTGTSLEGASECTECEEGTYSNSDLNINCTDCSDLGELNLFGVRFTLKRYSREGDHNCQFIRTVAHGQLIFFPVILYGTSLVACILFARCPGAMFLQSVLSTFDLLSDLWYLTTNIFYSRTMVVACIFFIVCKPLIFFKRSLYRRCKQMEHSDLPKVVSFFLAILGALLTALASSVNISSIFENPARYKDVQKLELRLEFFFETLPQTIMVILNAILVNNWTPFGTLSIIAGSMVTLYTLFATLCFDSEKTHYEIIEDSFSVFGGKKDSDSKPLIALNIFGNDDDL